MGARFEELDWQPTPIGEISLRRRRHPGSGEDVYEVKLGDEFLMSSLFTAGEIALAERTLATLPDAELDVAVGGLGLGCTARAVLEDPRVRSLTVIDAVGEVIDWHRRGLVPLGAQLTADPPAVWCTATSSPWSTTPAAWFPTGPGAASTPSPLRGGTSSNTVYLAVAPPAAPQDGGPYQNCT